MECVSCHREAVSKDREVMVQDYGIMRVNDREMVSQYVTETWHKFSNNVRFKDRKMITWNIGVLCAKDSVVFWLFWLFN